MWKSPPAPVVQGEMLWALGLPGTAGWSVSCRERPSSLLPVPQPGRLGVTPEAQLPIYRKPVCPVSRSCLVLLVLICHKVVS